MPKLSPTTAFDIDRGDRATIMRENYVKLVQWGFEMAAPILWGLARYMAGGKGDPVPELEHVEGLPAGVVKIMFGELLQMIEHQKTNARHAFEKSKSAQASALSRWGRQNANAHIGNANAQIENANAPDKNKKREKISDKLISSLRASKEASGGSPGGVSAGLAAANAAPPRVIVREYGDGETVEVREADLRNDPVPFMLAFIGEAEDSAPRARGAMIKRLKQLGADTFNAVAWQFVEEATAAANAWAKALDKYGPENIPADIEKASRDFEDNGGRTFAGRLKMKALALGFKD